MNDEIGVHHEFGERFKSLLEEAGYTKQQHKNLTVVLTKLFDVAPSTISDWRGGRKLPSMDRAIMIALKLDVCVEFLLTGRGQKRPNDQPNFISNADWEALPLEARSHFAEAVRAIVDSSNQPEKKNNHG